MTEAESGDRKELAELRAQVEVVKKMAGEAHSVAEAQKQALDALAARAEEIRSTVKQALQASNSQAKAIEGLKA